MRQVELAQRLGISKSYLSMILSGQRTIPEYLEIPFSELCEQNQLRKVPSKQRVVSSNRSRDATIVLAGTQNRPGRGTSKPAI